MYAECLGHYVETGEAQWIETVSGTNLSKFSPVLWTVLDLDNKINDSNVETATFEFQGQQYVLYVKNMVED